MNALRFPALMLFGLMLVGCAAMEVAQLVGAMEMKSVVCVDFEGEESEESEEERETQSEKEGKLKLKALLAARHRHDAFEAQHRHDLAPPGAMEALVTSRIWEPPELG